MYDKNFDISTLLNFVPPKYLCSNCYALLIEPPLDPKNNRIICPICGVEYLPTEDFNIYDFDKYMQHENLKIKFKDIYNHSLTFARISKKVRDFMKEPDNIFFSYPPMRGLLETLANAKKFVHFSTYGISHMFLGVIKVISQKVEVRGIISNVNDRLKKELTNYKDESPGLNINFFENNNDTNNNWYSIPHQKIIIVDGLIAFKGSANLTLSGWRKAAKGLDNIEIITNIKDVIDLNNKLFSPVWSKFKNVNQISMSYFPF